MDHPMPFIVTDDAGKPEITQEMREVISRLTKPVVVVTIAGVYRSGKSYLMNRLAQKSGEYFPLGSTVQSKTKGLWAWAGPHPHDDRLEMILIDTEGLADPEKASHQHDTWVFILALLLSNIFIYNSKGAIDNDSLNNLRLTAELSDHIVTKTDNSSSSNDDEEEDEDFVLHFPIFIWAIRDFILKREIDGEVFDDDDSYLEWALTQKRGQKRSIKQANDVKGAIRRFFPKRRCFLFPIPVTNSELMTNLDQASEEDLAQGFRDVSTRFLDYVFSLKEPKKVEGKGLNGRMYMTLVGNYVAAIRNNDLPCIENAMQMIASQENAKAHASALDAYRQCWSETQFPISDKTLHDIHAKAQNVTLDIFMALAIFDKDQQEARKMRQELEAELNQVIQENEKASIDACKRLLAELSRPIQERMSRGEYMRKGGYDLYQGDMDELKRTYHNADGLGDEKNRIFEDFMNRKEHERSSILQADKKLSKAEKRAEEERAHREREEEKAKVMEDEMARMKEEGERMQDNFQDAMEKMSREMREQTEREKEELRVRIEKEQQESLRLLKEGFKQDSEQLQTKIAELSKAMSKKDEMYLEAQQNFQREMMDRMEQQAKAHQAAMNNIIASMPRSTCGDGWCSIQ